MEVPEAYRTTTAFEGELVVYANTDIPASTSYVGTDISDLTFQLPSYTAPDALPMWGMRAITQGDNVVLTAGTRNDLTGKDDDAIDLKRRRRHRPHALRGQGYRRSYPGNGCRRLDL